MGRLLLASFLSLLIFSCEKSDIVPAPVADNGGVSTEETITANVLKSASSEVLTTVDLFAGQNILAGTVTISKTEGYLLVSYNTVNGFELDEAHVFVGESIDDMPQTKNGNPKIGNFPYVADGLSGSYYQFMIPLSEFGGEPAICDKMFYVAAHAALVKDNGDGSFQTETGWGDGDRIVDKGSWATYFSFVYTCEIVNPPSSGDCETAFAFGDQSFIDLGLTDSRWGWVIELDQFGVFTAPIYAGAGQNDISKGTHVGTLTYRFDGSVLTVAFTMFNGFFMDETHLYASTDMPTAIAPGQYGGLHDLDGASSDQYTVSVNGGAVYIIAHAVVCR